MLKRIISALIVVAMLCTMAPFAFAEGTPTITVAAESVLAGTDTATVTISLANNPGIVSMGLTLDYPEGLEILSVTDGELLKGSNLYEPDEGEAYPSPYTLNWADDTAKNNNTNNGTLVTVVFKIKDSSKKATYPITITYDNNNYDIFDKDWTTVDFEVVNDEINVTLKPIEGVTFPSSEVTYDGKEHEVAVKGLPSNIEGIKVQYTDNKGTDAGTYNAKALITAPGYEDLELTTTLTINKAKLTVSNLKAENKVYDGTDKATINSSAAALTGVAAGDDISVDWPSEGTFKDGKAVGNNKAVEIKELVLNGSAAKNYILISPALSASITKAPLSINVEDVNLKIDAKLPSKYNYIKTGLIEGDDVVIEVAANGASTAVAGKTFPITATVKGSDIGNYDISIKNGTLTIIAKTPQKFDVGASSQKVYGDNPFNLDIIDGNTELGAFTFSSSNENVATIDADGLVTIKNAGTAVITVSRKGNDDIADKTATCEITVDKKPISINATSFTLKQNNAIPELKYTVVGGLVGDDKITGELAVAGDGTVLGSFPITQGTLKISDNYAINFVQGTMTVIDKDAQKVTFKLDSEVITYGDEKVAFIITDETSVNLGDFEYASDNTDVAEVIDFPDAVTGKVIKIKKAGTANITISRKGNEDFADYTFTQPIVVNKKKITVTATSFTLKQNNPIPELKYTTDVELVEGDSFTGALAVNGDGKALGNFDITQGTLKLSDNYILTFVKGVMTVIDKDPQAVTIPASFVKAYGDAPFEIEYTDNSSSLGDLNFVIDNEDVIAFKDNGEIEVKNVGSATITVSRKGNDDFADLEKVITVTVNKATVIGFKDYAEKGPEYNSLASTAYENGLTSAEKIAEAFLPATVNVSYGAYEDVEEVEIIWAPAKEAYNVKGGTYTYVGTPKENKNLDFGSLTLTATATIEAIVVEVESALNDVTVAETTVKEAIDFPDIERIPATVVIGEKTLDAKWNKTIADLKAVPVDGSLEIALDLEAMGVPYLTVTNKTSFLFKVTDKYPVTVTVTQEGSVYGTALNAPVPSQVALDDGIAEDAQYTYLYKGTTANGAAYESADAPKDAGTYTVTATLVSATHAGSGTSAEFTIAPFDVTYNVDNKEKKYKEANPEFTGALAEGTVLPYEETVEGLGITFNCSTEVAPAGTVLDITAEAANKNYNVTAVKGGLTIVKKPLSDEDIPALVITGSGQIGLSLIAGKLPGVDGEEYEYAWFINDEYVTDNATAEFIPAITDAGKLITVKAKAKDINYTYDNKASEAVVIGTYEIKGNLGFTNGDNATIAQGNTITVDLTKLDNISIIDANGDGAEFSYQWKLNGVAIEGATAKDYLIGSEDEGTLTVDVTANAPFSGTLTLTVGEIGKAIIPGSVEIAESEGTITLTNSITTAIEGEDYELVWYKDGAPFTVEGETYEILPEDAGKTITVKAVAKGETFTGEIFSSSFVVPAAIPSNVAITTTVTATTITATFTADENGAPIQKFVATITDGTTTEIVDVANVDGTYKYTFEGLTTGTLYTISANAYNLIGVDIENASVTATPVAPVAPVVHTGGGGSSYVTIKFNSNGGSDVATIRVKKNASYTKPANPTKDGFVFDGWYTDKALTKAYTFPATLTSSVTLYAKWSTDIAKKQIVLTIGEKNATVFGEAKANDVAPKIVNSRTMLPIRFVAEALGATVTWTEAEPDKVIITKGEIKIEITINSDKAYVNNSLVTLDSPAFLENDRTYMPLRFITENLGEQVEWDEKTQKVTITIK